MTLDHLSLAQFRSWPRLDLDLDARPLAIFGPFMIAAWLNLDVQTAAREFNGGSSQVTQPVQPANVVSLLTFGRYVLPAVQQSGKGVSDDAARKLLDKVENPSRSTLDFVRTALALNSMDPATEEKVVQQLKQADIELNPRYGSLDRKTLQIGPETRNWLVADAAGAPSPAPTTAPAP